MAQTNSLTYNAFATALGVMAVEATQTVGGVVQGVSAAFTTNIPLALSYAENRIQRDVSLVPAMTSMSSYSLIAGNNVLSLATGDFVTVETISINGAPLLPVSKEFLQNVYGTNANSAQPVMFAPYGGDQSTGGNTANNFIVGPWPDSNYPLVITGMQRLPSLYKFANVTDANTGTTFISTWLPDLLLTASMIWLSGFQRNFAATSDQPEMGVSWEVEYGKLIAGVGTEEARKRFASSAWSSQAPTPVATPTR